MRDTGRGRGLVLGLSLGIGLAAAGAAHAADRALWLRYPAISPDGQTVAFSYKGNLWKVPAAGGTAIPLTVSEAHNTMPVWSPDGKVIAFASDRYGNFDVFVMPAEGGEARRLTFHSADELPTSFTPDGKAVLFTAAIMGSAASTQFPTPAQPQLYEVSVGGGMPNQLLTTPAMYAVYDRTGRRLAYSDQKGYEMEWRKHDTSAFARDLWLYDAATGVHTELTQPGADNRQPVWSPDENSLYYLSERSGSFNVWRLDLADPRRQVQVTSHTTDPVRFLSVSRRGDLCYGYEGEIWVRPAGSSESRRLAVSVAADGRRPSPERVDVGGEISEFDVSPDGKEIAFIARGEVFVASTEHGVTRRITNTPEQERSVSFSPDGRTLLYASERDGGWKLYRTDLTDKNEPNFFNATALKESLVLGGENDVFQPHFSPDGAEIAYLEERTTLKVLNLKTGKSRTVLPGDRNYSYSDGDQWYEWSPDGRWFAVQFLSNTRWSNEVGLIPSSGEGALVNVSKSGYEDNRPMFARKGEVLIWATDRHGLRSQAGEGREYDVYAAFLTKKAWDRYRLDDAEFDQLKAKEKDEAKEKAGEKGKAGAGEAKTPAPAPQVAIEFPGLDDRIVRLSPYSAQLSGMALSPDGETLYDLARFEKGYDLWKYVPRTKEVKLVAKLDAKEADLRLDREGKKAFILADSRLMTVDLESGKTAPVKASAMMELNPAAERAYLFRHIWRQTWKKFLVTDMHGVDWKAVGERYARFLPDIDNDRDFAELISEMQGELNASHSGGRYRPLHQGGDETAALGFFPDPKHAGPGVGVLEVVEGGPLQQAGTKIRAGVVIEAIDGSAIAAGQCWYPLLNHKAGALVRLALFDPMSGARWEETVKPISWMAQSHLLYERWVRSRRDVDKDAIVLDTRFNGGGNLVEQLTTFLSGRIYARDVPRGREVGTEPTQRWTKPSIVIMSEGNYSDAHCFPMAYTQLGLGETVGMPVPGTCTSVWWERLQDKNLVFGIPEVALVDMHGDIMENKQLMPTHMVANDPALVAAGRDQQLEKAVAVLLAKLPKR